MAKIAVIGANSFTGGYVVDELLKRSGHTILGIDRVRKSKLFLPYLSRIASSQSKWQYASADLNYDQARLQRLLKDFRPDYIMNLAALSEVAPSWIHPDQWFQTNVVALTRMVNFLKDLPSLKKYVHISSPEVYGTCRGTVKEDAPLNPSTPYAVSKAAADLSLATFYKQYGFPVVTMRATNVYGAHQQLFKIIPRTVIYLKQGKTIELHGGGTAVKSYIHARDVARGYIAAFSRGKPGEIYHLSPDGGIAVRDVVKKICRLLNKDFHKVIRVVAERPGQDKAYVIDSRKARRAFNWRPKIDLDKGLHDVIAWVDKYWEDIKQQPLDYIHQA